MNLKEILDIPALQKMMEALYQASGFPCGLISREGEILVAVGWQDICQKFFRQHPETLRRCQESDAMLAGSLRPGEFSVYQCANGLIDMATPIVLEDVHVATLFLGQFFFSPPDPSQFRQMAAEYGFPETEFCQAFARVPVISRKKAEEIMEFYARLAGLLINLGTRQLTASRREHEKAEALLRLQRLAETTQDGVWEWNVATGEVYFSDQYYQMLGYSPGAFPASFASWEGLLHPDDLAPSQKTVTDYLARGGAGFDIEFRMRHQDGSYRWIMGRGRMVEADSEGRPAKLVGIHIDISQRKAREQALENDNQELSRLVAERTARLEDYTRELEAFSYSVSHDLRAPLRAVDGFALAMEEDYGHQLDATGLDYLHRMRKASCRMSDLIDDMLKLSRITRRELVYQQIDFTELCWELAEELNQAKPGESMDWEIEDGMTLHGDRGLLRVAMVNLLENAWKFTAGGEAARIRIFCRRQGEQVSFCIEDNGQGFDMKYASRLFAPFSRLPNSGEQPGNGIGLATVQRIIHRHGGGIAVDSTPGKGSCFCFYLGGAEGEEPSLEFQGAAPAEWQ